MARKVIDLTGQRFGNFTVIKRSEEKDTDNQIKWLCQCDCEKFDIVRGYNLRNGISKSCGCLKTKENDYISKKFGKLTVIKRAEKTNKSRDSYYLCVCDCGKERVVRGSELKNGKATSCGCSIKTHGKSKTRLHIVWCGMKQRCYNENRDSYKWYGAKGVTVCEEWRKSFDAFYDWAMANGYDENAKTGQCTLDRIDPFGNYEPSNCRWVDSKVQASNQRKNREAK